MPFPTSDVTEANQHGSTGVAGCSWCIAPHNRIGRKISLATQLTSKAVRRADWKSLGMRIKHSATVLVMNRIKKGGLTRHHRL